MAEDFCFALLRTSSLQILKAAGFEGVESGSANALTDVFGKYIQLLASTSSEYARLAGRSHANALDVVDGLNELSIDLKSLEDWLQVDGKFFTPPWSDQADPSKALQNILPVQKEIEKPFVYEYVGLNGSIPTTSFSPMQTQSDDAMAIAKPPMNSSLPDYVPSFLPNFPLLNKDDELENAGVLENDAAVAPPPSASQPNAHLLNVRKKKKPISNPFTHITPYEESTFTTDADASSLALSALPAPVNNASSAPSPPSAVHHSVAAQRDINLKRVMDTYDRDRGDGKRARPPVGSVMSHVFQQDTEEHAAAGNRLFGHSAGMLGDIVRQVAPPLALSTLSTPNLLVDIISTDPPAPISAQDPHSSTLITLPVGPSSTTSTPAPSSATSISLTLPARPPTHRDELEVIDDFLDTPAAAERIESQQISQPISLMSLSSQQNQQLSSKPAKPKLPKGPKKTPKLPKEPKKKKAKAALDAQPKLTIKMPTLQKQADDTTPSSSSFPHTAHHDDIDISSVSPPSSASTPKIRFTLKIPKQTPPPAVKAEPLSPTALHTGNVDNYHSLLSTQPPPSSLSTLSHDPFELNLSTAPSSAASTSTPTFAPPPSLTSASLPSQTPPASTTAYAPPSFDIPAGSAEEIRCICDNPTIDYGAFMIACDTCGVWFHGLCVGISELDQVEEWHCMRCHPR